MKGHCLGLIGGLGVAATVHYYTGLADAHARNGATLDMVMAHADTSHIFRFATAQDRFGMADYMNGYLQRLKDAGAEFAAIPAVTPHFCFHELAAISPIPLLEIFTPLRLALKQRAPRRAVIIGTRFAIESRLFGMVPEVEFVLPHEDEIETIHRVYAEVVDSRRLSAWNAQSLIQLARLLATREQAEAIILAGSDLSPFAGDLQAEIPVIDCAQLHISWITEVLLGKILHDWPDKSRLLS